MTVHDYNGEGRWSVASVIRRYDEYATRFCVENRHGLVPKEHRAEGRVWFFPVMEKVIAGIRAGDPACTEIGLEFIEESQSFPFGKILKAQTAKALRQFAALSESQRDRVRRRVIEMLKTEYLPREFREYLKLARKIGIRKELRAAQRQLNFENTWVQHYFKLLTDTHSPKENLEPRA